MATVESHNDALEMLKATQQAGKISMKHQPGTQISCTIKQWSKTKKLSIKLVLFQNKTIIETNNNCTKITKSKNL